MRIPHRNREPEQLTRDQLNSRFISHGGLAHGNLKLVLGFTPAGQHASFQASASMNGNPLFLLGWENVSGNTSRTIPGNLSGRAIGVDQANLNIRRWVRIHPLHAICPHPVVPIAHALRQRREIRVAFENRSIDQQKIVAARAGLHKRSHRRRKAHSNSTGPNEATPPSTVDAFRSRSNSFWSRLHPDTSNCKRTCRPVLPLKTFCIMRWRCSRMRLTSCVISSTLAPVTS